MTSKPILPIIAAAAGVVLSAMPTQAQNAFYAPGDLVLFFQKTGSTNTVYANLGNAAKVFRGSAAGPDASNKINILDLNSTLTSAFGSGWATDATIYAGLAGVFGNNATSNALVDGDPQRTLYISAARNSIGTMGVADSTAWDLVLAGNSAMTSTSGGIQTQNNILETNYTTQTAISPTSVSQIDDQNPFLSPGIQGNAMGNNLEGGIQQVGTSSVFGSVNGLGNVEFALDLYRVLAKNTISGQVAGGLRVGSFEGTIVVGTNGKVSFVTSDVTAFDTWAATYPTLDTDAQRKPTGDADGDGFSNLYEFGFGGNPTSTTSTGAAQTATVDANSDGLRDITLTMQVLSGAVFSSAGNGTYSSTVNGVTYVVGGSADLSSWTSPVLPVVPSLGTGSPSAGYEFRTFRLQSGNGLIGKGFLRATVTN